MRAVVVNETGGPEVLSYEEIADPTPGPDELLVGVEAAGVNFIDTYHRGGLYQLEPPFILGLEGAGTVLDTGVEVSEFAIGDRVTWTDVMGSYASRLAVPASRAVPVPADLELKTAAALLLQGTTAHYLVTDTFQLSPGHRCLIHAGAGGVGLLLTQLAKKAGAEVVTTVGSPEKSRLSWGAGADHVIVYTETDFRAEAERKFGPRPFDVVYDGVGATTFDDSLELLRPRGMMVTFGNASGPVPPISPLLLSQKGSLFLTRPTMRHYVSEREELLTRCEDLFEAVLDGQLTVRIGAEYPLQQAADAHRALEGRATTGKVILLP